MHRFYMPPERCAGDVLRLDGREAHHAAAVLRLRRGDPVTILDGAGHEIRCEIDNATRQAVTLTVRARIFVPPLPCQITLIQALPKGKLMDSIVQKAVELGARRIVPVLSERVVSHLDEDGAEARQEKWQQVAVEAIKQSGATWLPEVESPVSVEECLARHESFDLTLVGSLQPGRRHPREVLAEYRAIHNAPPKSIGIWIGPEGDLTPEELSAIQSAGAQPVTLGRLVLRVETAAIYCLSILNYELNITD